MPYSRVVNTEWPSYRRIARSISNKYLWLIDWLKSMPSAQWLRSSRGWKWKRVLWRATKIIGRRRGVVCDSGAIYDHSDLHTAADRAWPVTNTDSVLCTILQSLGNSTTTNLRRFSCIETQMNLLILLTYLLRTDLFFCQRLSFPWGLFRTVLEWFSSYHNVSAVFGVVSSDAVACVDCRIAECWVQNDHDDW